MRANLRAVACVLGVCAFAHDAGAQQAQPSQLPRPTGQASEQSGRTPADDEWLAPLPSVPRVRPSRGALTAPEHERKLLLGVGLGACFIGGRWSSAGLCAKVDFSYLVAFRGGALTFGLEINYERYSNIYEPGLVPGGSALADLSGLSAGIPIAVRFYEPNAAFVPYLGIAALVVTQSSRYVVTGNQIVDTSTERMGMRPFFGAEVRIGPGAMFGEASYRATWALFPGAPQVKHDGAQFLAGYRLRF